MTNTTARARVAERTASLRVDRTDIRFRNIAFDRVAIEIDVHNDGDAASRPTLMSVEVAAFGAFLPWRPLTVECVPAIGPRQSATVAFEALRAPARPLGSFETVPPDRLATAAAAGDAPEGEPTGMFRAARTDPCDRGRAVLSQAHRRLFADAQEQRASTPLAPVLPTDLFGLLGRTNTHWVGNLNVFAGRRRVERHRAPALRVYPGRPNLAMFCVGTGPDAYSFELSGSGAAWSARLMRTRGSALGLLRGRGEEFRPGSWQDFAHTETILAFIEPPQHTEFGALEIHVRQRSSGECAVVEFDLDARAAGPGCYVV